MKKFKQLNALAEKLRTPIYIIFEGRDGAGKSGTIDYLSQYLPPDCHEVIRSAKPSNKIMRSWIAYWNGRFKSDNKIFFYDRSHYSRALVQRVNSWATSRQVENFMQAVPELENRKGLFIKVWLSITEKEQARRLSKRKNSKLVYWKFSDNDSLALSRFDAMTLAKQSIIDETWHVIDFNDKAKGRKALLKLIVTEIKRWDYILDVP